MATTTPTSQSDSMHRSFDFTVDGDPFSTEAHELTPNAIMAIAGVDGSTHYLVEIRGRTQISYRDAPDEPIHLHEHAKFATLCTGPTPVS